MKTGLLFGSFNPLHIGHLIIASFVANFYTDEVWFVVSPQSPFKKEIDLLEAEFRYKIAAIAIENDERFKAVAVELNMSKPSYTINTLKELKRRFGNHEFSLIVGSDNYKDINKWKSGNDILKNYKILVYERPGFFLKKDQFFENHIKIDAPLLNISSTSIRKLIAENKNINYLVPEKVVAIINQNNYYR